MRATGFSRASMPTFLSEHAKNIYELLCEEKHPLMVIYKVIHF